MGVAVVVLFSLSLFAQNELAMTVPYSMGFEEGETEKLAYWHINEGYDPAKCQEQWVIGNAVKTEGKRSLYISCDAGETCTYDSVWNTTYAYMDFTIPSGQYELSFDWRCLVESGV